MLNLMIDKPKTINLWHFLWIAVFLSGILSAIISIILKDNIVFDYLFTCGVVSLIVAFIIISIFKQLHKTEESLIKRAFYLDNMFRSSTGMSIASTDKDFRIIYFNPAAEKLFGYKVEEVISKTIMEIHTKEKIDPSRFEKAIETVKIEGEYMYTLEKEKEDGIHYIESRVSGIWDKKENIIGYVLMSKDVTDRKKAEIELEKLATLDKLTQTYNRIKFEEIIVREIERARRYNHSLSMIMFDIDHFKIVNDTYGHVIGDHVLKSVADIAKEKTRKTDYLIRWGGEEFMIISPDTELESAEELAERIRQMIEDFTFNKNGNVTVSFGVTQFTNDDTEDTFIKRADDALYKAKMKGRNRVEVET